MQQITELSKILQTGNGQHSYCDSVGLSIVTALFSMLADSTEPNSPFTSTAGCYHIYNTTRSNMYVKRPCINCYGKPIAGLQSITCHMGSDSVTCHSTQVNTPLLGLSQTGQYLIYLPQRDEKPS